MVVFEMLDNLIFFPQQLTPCAVLILTMYNKVGNLRTPTRGYIIPYLSPTKQKAAIQRVAFFPWISDLIQNIRASSQKRATSIKAAITMMLLQDVGSFPII